MSARDRFVADRDEDRQEEFCQLLASYNRFYAFLAQIMRLGDSELEKLHAYGLSLARLLPRRDGGEDIEITDEMIRLQAQQIACKEGGEASLEPGEVEKLPPITEFGARGYSEDEQKTLTEILESFNERHATDFWPEDFLQGERANAEILHNEILREQLLNNAPDVALTAYHKAFMDSVVKVFQKDRSLQTILLADPEARDQMTRFFFGRAMRELHRNEESRHES